MRNDRPIQLVRAALLAALCLVLTKVVTIPTFTGYVNLGDCAVLLSGWMLGPVYGGMAAGIGSMLADILSGYPMYAPATFVIKGAMAVVAALMFKAVSGRGKLSARIVGGVLAECIMVVGYFGYECLVLGYGLAAAASVFPNVVQGAVGVIAGVLLASALEKGNQMANA